MGVTLRGVVIEEPDPEAVAAWDAALDIIADAFADQLIAEARAEAAARLGVDEASIDHRRESLTRVAGAELRLPLELRGRGA